MVRIVSFNCQSFNSNFEIIDKLLSHCDFLLLQETLVTEHNANFFNKLDKKFNFCYQPAVRSDSFSYGRPSGGLTIIWHSSLNIPVHPIYISDRILGVKLVFPDICVLILNIYATCDYRTSQCLVDYKSSLCDLSNVLEFENFDEVVIAGDFNCDPSKGRFYREFSNFASSHSLITSDINSLPPDSFTYVSRSSECATSWLDHALCSNGNILRNFEIMYGFTFEDHIPLYFELHVDSGPHYPNESPPPYLEGNFIAWDKLTEYDVEMYAEYLEEFSMSFIHDSLMCRENNCNNQNHIENLDKIYSIILDHINDASIFFPCRNGDGFLRRVGWNDHCKTLYDEARGKFLEWKIAGKPRDGNLFTCMKSSRKLFRNALNYCRKNELEIKKRKLVESFKIENKNKFWKDVRKINKVDVRKQTMIDNQTELDEIIKIFDLQYRDTLDDSRSQSTNDSSNLSENSPLRNCFMPHHVSASIEKLNPGFGWDFIHSNHLKYTGIYFRMLIGRLFLAFLRHNFIPKSMLKGEIRPTLKNGKPKKESRSYRPVMNSSVLLKTFEYCLLPVVTSCLPVNLNQFGFVKNSNCQKTIAILKEVLHSYISKKSEVHCAMLDLSKAFDKIDLNLLKDKLSNTRLPPCIIRIIYFMYTNAYVNVKFNDKIGPEWKVGNGVRQGGILSAYLFNFYIYEMIEEILNLNVGCFLANMNFSILCYADDIVLLCPSANGLQFLIDKSAEHLRTLFLDINIEKSNYLVFKKSKYKNIDTKVKLNGINLNRVQNCKYLGVILSDVLSIHEDTERVLNSFLKQFNALYYRFNFIQSDILKFLFKTYAFSFYGSELWFETISQNKCFNNLAIAYHKAVKRICHLNVWDSNHLACELVGVPVFKHLHASRIFEFYLSLLNSRTPVYSFMKYYFRFSSNIGFNVKQMFKYRYDIVNLLENDRLAVHSRIKFIERTEPRSTYTFSL